MKQIERRRRTFLWANKKLHLIKWEKICSPKSSGGLGLSNLSLRNKSLLGKWWWRWLKDKGKLWRNMVLQKYGLSSYRGLEQIRHSNFMSPVLQGIGKIADDPSIAPMISVNSFQWRVGEGTKILF